jgi:hypothetical protein
LALAALCLLWAVGPLTAQENRNWDFTPYRIQIHLAVETAAAPEPELASALAAELTLAAQNTLAPLWRVEIELAQDAWRYDMLHHLGELDPPPHVDRDKVLLLTVEADHQGYALACREFDAYLRQWGAVVRSRTAQRIALPRRAFALLRNTFAPLATIGSDPDQPELATLQFKGQRLANSTDEPRFAVPGDVFEPLRVRTTSTGEIAENGVAPIPWTYLTAAEPLEDVGWQAAVSSGVRLPFGIRRRARVEHLAIAVRSQPGATEVRFHSRSDQGEPLAGYQVYVREEDDQASRLLGSTDRRGIIELAPTDKRITTLFLRSEAQVLAKVPVVPGAVRRLEVPIAEDSARLYAETSLISLSEQLMDLVARRNILVARVRAALDEGQIDEAQELVSQIDSLQTRAQFDQLLTSAQESATRRTDDKKILASIESRFADTRALLGKFLDSRDIAQLQSEVLAAGRGE